MATDNGFVRQHHLSAPAAPAAGRPSATVVELALVLREHVDDYTCEHLANDRRWITNRY